ncbi:lysylphosphatidylglycerol synthase domain-containing protein [Chelativorans sp. AA-79]|uniref:lysylphosphatidylglycerol synthase domain-containing protein n=1 Tax=Chelativorans sp. AA-79 TaxID=3028735 RepID=UPI0023F84267|nr:lysylphosphatidylglycerol synthase domain-containing protein [Chelativorans sp. AA-79]WEX09477.1 lysylphosphatidylglycerol synthase domain-containing protein [Chelativorans sp. AA-79]
MKPPPAHRPVRRYLGYAITVAAVLLASYLLYRTLSQYEWEELVSAVTAVSVRRLLFALGFTAASYLCLTGFDWLALRYAKHPLSYPRAALASFTSLSLGHSIGFAALSSGAVRYRFYSRWGLSGEEVAKVIVFCGFTVGLGLSVLGGIGLIANPGLAEKVIGVTPGTVYLIGAACLAWPAVYLLLTAFFGGRALHIRGRRVEMPVLKLALGQVIVGPINFAFVAAALHQAALSLAEIPYLEVATAFVSANVATVITHVPGGLGVIESVVLYLLPQAHLIGAVLVFRFVYFLLPLFMGSILLVLSEAFLSRSRASETAS